MLSCGCSGHCGGGYGVCNPPVYATVSDDGRITVAVVDIKVGNREVSAVELAGEEKKISGEEQTF